jgi:hypothetical protein
MWKESCLRERLQRPAGSDDDDLQVGAKLKLVLLFATGTVGDRGCVASVAVVLAIPAGQARQNALRLTGWLEPLISSPSLLAFVID